ncbi:MAG: amidohydrolase family protein [Burkholderiaceae bacterium]
MTVDSRFADKILLPGLIDNHVHPFLGALLTPTEIIAPEAWRMDDGSICPAARTPAEFRARLEERLAARTDTDEWFISWGYQPLEHGRMFRPELDALCPDRPVVLWQRSFHETYLNSRAIEKLGIDLEQARTHPQIDLDDGHFYETGNKVVTAGLMRHFLRPEWYHRGLGILASLMHQGGITTAGDMLFGALDPDFELDAIERVIVAPGRPLRIVNIADARGFSNRARRLPMGAPDVCPPFDAGLPAIDALRQRATPRVRFAKAVKLFADGAMFSQLMQMRPPGYIDGHHGEWLMTPDVLDAGVRTFWNAGYQIHVHVNGDAGMDAVLASLARAQASRPRFDHRFTMHHVGFHTNAQTTRIAALGAHASVNPYYIHALADTYAARGLGPERAAQIVRAGSLVKAGVRVSLHSDFPMAPTEPLLLAHCAAARRTRSGAAIAPAERLSLTAALRGITIDAAFALDMDDEIGSIVAGKLADFTVLADDPYDLGAERLHEVRVAATVFEGRVHLLERPSASVHARAATHALAAATGSIAPSAPARAPGLLTRLLQHRARDPIAAAAPRYRPVAPACCQPGGDFCDTLRSLADAARAVLARPWTSPGAH